MTSPHVVTITFVCNELEPGWTIMDDHVPLGKRYKADLTKVEEMTIFHADGRRKVVDCIYVLGPGGEGWLPLAAFKVEES